MDYAEKYFPLIKPDKNGTTLKEHLEQVYKQTGAKPSELDLPEFPYQLSLTWAAFVDLSNSRPPAFSGVAPITYEQIKAYKDTTYSPISGRDIQTIKRIDNIFLSVINKS